MKLFTSKYLSFKLIILLIFVSFINAAAQEINGYSLIPYPAKLIAGKGAFIITSKTNIVTASRFKDEANELNELVSKGLGKKLSITKNAKGHSIKLVYDAAITSPEAYKLTITTQQVIIAAKDAAGVLHAVETIRQLLPVSVEKGVADKQLLLPAVSIADHPAYEFRKVYRQDGPV
jgi:hexosaminidase